MSRAWKRFVSLLSGAEADAPPAAFVGGFGKHPGWDDHIDSLGDTTALLADLQNWMYVEGIGSQIENGAWDRLAPEQRLESFDHTFLFSRGAETIIGMLWSSRDGKGRSKYPMVVCAQWQSAPASWAARHSMPALQALRGKCMATGAAGEVRAAVEAARASLAATLEQGVPPIDPSEPECALANLSRCPELGENSKGLLSVFYQIDHELGALLQRDGALASGASSHFRVPACGVAPEAPVRWINFLRLMLAPETPVLALCPANQAYLDLIVGRSNPAQFLCLLANAKALPMTTDIPYEIEDEFRQKTIAAIEQSRARCDAAPAPERQP